MAQIAPLRPLRFTEAELPDVVAPPYDVIDAEERARLAARSSHNIVHLDLPEGEGDQKYANAATLLRAWNREGVLRRADCPMLLRYEQDFDPPDGGARVTRRGFFALVRAEPYEARVILPHERTLSGPKEDRYKLLVATRAALSPVFLLYSDPSGAASHVLDGARPTTSFTTEDGVTHRLAVVADEAAVARLTRAFEGRQLLIADGHHRYETTLQYGETIDAERARAGLPAAPDGAHHFVLAFLADADDPGLVVFPTHRIVHGLEGFNRQAMLRAAAETFVVRAAQTSDAAGLVRELAEAGREGPSVVAVFPDGAAQVMTLRNDVDVSAHPALGARPEVLRRLDVAVLHAAILETLLGITPEQQAAQTHLRYVKSAADALAQIERGEGDVLFLMNGTPVEQVRRVCEAGEVMPQKSTYFYPKVLTGLAVHVLDPEDAIELPRDR